jgi:phospholipid-binding lipoprotein MlaA
MTVASLISARSELMDSGADKLLDSSADSYATAHSAYLQRRRALILDNDDGSDAGAVDLEDFDTSGESLAPTTTGETPNPSGETPPTPAPATAPSGADTAPTTDAAPAPTPASSAPPPADPASPSSAK